MHMRIRSLLAPVFGLALTCSLANAQLLLSGYTTGSFTDLSEAHTTVTNAPDGSSASFSTGVAATGSTQSIIAFSNATFTDVGFGDPIQVGVFSITNGKTLIGTGAHTALFNLGLTLTSPITDSVAVSTVTFNIDHTVNGVNGSVPDIFSVSFAQPPPTQVGNFLVQFHLNVVPLDFPVAENSTVEKGDITVTFTPVPEPATYAMWGAALLLGLVAYRRIRGSKSLAELPTLA